MTAQSYLQAAFAALLKGNTDERDRQCALAEKALEEEKYAGVKRLMETDFFVTPQGIVIPIQAMMAKA